MYITPCPPVDSAVSHLLLSQAICHCNVISHTCQFMSGKSSSKLDGWVKGKDVAKLLSMKGAKLCISISILSAFLFPYTFTNPVIYPIS